MERKEKIVVIKIDPMVRQTFEAIIQNLDSVELLLKQNAELISKLVQGSLQIIETPLNRTEVITRECDGAAAETTNT